MQLDGKVALVTGASRGIGQAIAKGLQDVGAMVIGTATTESGANRITENLTQDGKQGVGMVLDVTNSSAIKQVLNDIREHYGAPLILVNNAGITRDNLMLRMQQEEWDEVLNTNLSSIYRMTQMCLRDMMKARWGRVVNVASVVALTGNPGQANYAAAKAGIIGFSKSLAAEIASRGITINVVAPGFIDTDMTRSLEEGQREAIMGRIPMGRLGQPEDIANAVVYLALAGYVTGETLHINGGMYMA